MAKLEDQFKTAAEHFQNIYKECSDNEKLKMYALYNQAMSGDVTEKEPPATQMVKRAKWKARKRVAGMTSEQAMRRYVAELRRMDPAWVSGDNETEDEAKKREELDAEVAPGKVESGAGTSNNAAGSSSSSSSGGGVTGIFRRKSKPAKAAATNAAGTSTTTSAPPKTDKATFEKAVNYASKSGLFRDENQRTILYAWYKQAIEGPNKRPAPMFAMRKRYARWRAWSNLFDMSKEEAMARYVQRVRKIAGPAFDEGAPPEDPTEDVDDEGLERAQGIVKAIDANSQQEKSSTGSPDSFTDSPADIERACSKAHEAGGEVYLVTGATGFVGKHLLGLLLDRHPGSIIFAVTRASSKTKLAKQAESRYGEDRAWRIVGLTGDIKTSKLGIKPDQIKALTNGKVDHVVHIAASYDMKASDEENEQSNVGGTQAAVEVANEIKAGIFHHTSSIAVAGDYDGMFFEDMFNEGQSHDHAYLRTKYESEALVREKCSIAFRVYRPGLIIGSSETGEADKIDGPYYLFKAIQQLRKWLPQAVVIPVIQGETQPIVPVDYVVKAMNVLIHKKGIDGRAFHLVDPNPPTLEELLNIFSKAAHGPQFSARIPSLVLAMLPKQVWSALSNVPIIQNAPNNIVSRVLGVPDSVIGYANWLAEFDDADTRDALRGSGVRCPPLKSYAWRCWDYYERVLDTRNVDRPRAIQKETSGKTVVITGSSDGIGATLAKRLAKSGAKVILVARNKDKLKAVGDEIRGAGGEAHEQVCDISKGEDCVSAMKEILKTHKKVDFLVNNAGRSIRRSVEYQYTPDRFHDFERTIQLNYYGAIRMILGVLPHMRERKEGQIVNVSSVGVATNAPRFGAYVASKAAMDGFSRCVSGEIHNDNVVISTVYMPLVATKMVVSKGNKFDHMNLLTPEEACQLIERAMVTKERTVQTLTARFVSLAYYFAPALVEAILNHQYRLEPEAAPSGQQESKAAAGDKQQLKALGMLLKGGTLAGGGADEEES